MLLTHEIEIQRKNVIVDHNDQDGDGRILKYSLEKQVMRSLTGFNLFKMQWSGGL
jgi:hypothetical protein